MMLLPFRNVTREPAHEWLTTGAPLMLAEALSQYRDLAVVAEERVTAARRRLGFATDAGLDETQLLRLAEQTDGWTAVTGNVLAAGGRLRLTAQALDIPTASVVARAEADTPADADVRPAFERLSVQLLEAVGVRAAPTDVAARTTQSVEAYRAYVRGIQAWQRSAYADARQAFGEAVRLDSTFALAWARLALASLSANVFDLLVPANPIGRAINRAAALAPRLPPRQAQLIRSMQEFFNGRPARARQIADSLVATDADDLDAREWAASVGQMDPTLDLTARPARLAASLNRPVLLTKEILERDPGRRHTHAIPTMIYATGAGLWGMLRGGVSGEFGSIGAMLMTMVAREEAAFVPVLRDSLVAMPRHEFLRLPADEQRRLRTRSADAASEWVERWLAAGPNDADAHLWASRVADVRGEYPRALREATIAESLGVQSSFENVRSRRLRLLILTGARSHAAALADSILASREFAVLTPITLDQGRAYAASVFILAKQWTRLERLVEASGVNPFGGQSPCINVVTDFSSRMGTVDPALVREVMDTAAAHFGAPAGGPGLEGCAGNFAGTLLEDSTTVRRTFAARVLMQKADSLYGAGNEALAYRALRQAWAVDTSGVARGRLLAHPRFMARSRAMAFARTFAPESAEVHGDSAVFAFRATEAGPWELSYPQLPSRWAFVVEIAADSVSVMILARHDYRGGDGHKSGGLSIVLSELNFRRVTVTPNNALGAASRVDAVASPTGFRLVMRGPAVEELRRLTPATARFRSEPCLAVSDGLCAEPSVAIVYRR